MADGDGTAVDVEPLHRNAELALAIQSLRGKGLVQLPQGDVFDLEARTLEQAGHGEHGANAHLVGLAARHGKAAECAQGLQATALGLFRFHHHAGGRAV